MPRPTCPYVIIRVNDTERGWALADRATGEIVQIAGGKVEGVTKDVAEALATTLPASLQPR